MSLRVLSILLVFIAVTSFAQIPDPPEEKLRESVFVDLVDLYLTATDKKGKFITDLQAEDLIVSEGGIPQAILQFGPFAGETGDVPLLLAMVIDSSASMDDEIEEVKKLDLAREAALMWMEELGPLDQAMLVSFNETAHVTPLTSDRALIHQELQKLRPNWRHTAFFDALSTALDELRKASGRKILFVCSDGLDNMSKKKMEDVLEEVSRTSELTVVVLGTVATDVNRMVYKTTMKKPPERFRKGQENLQTLADKTAGYAFFPTNRKGVLQARELMRTFIRSQYSLSYRSTNRTRDGSWRPIRITCKRKDVVLHYRQGYYAN